MSEIPQKPSPAPAPAPDPASAAGAARARIRDPAPAPAPGPAPAAADSPPAAPQPAGPGVIRVGVALVTRGRGSAWRVLVTRRRADSLYGGYWEFPGGKVEPGEDPAACVVREVAEELGLVVEAAAAEVPIEHVYEHGHVQLWPWWCRVVRGEPRALEVDAWRWVTPGELRALRMLPANGPLIEAVARAAPDASLNPPA